RTPRSHEGSSAVHDRGGRDPMRAREAGRLEEHEHEKSHIGAVGHDRNAFLHDGHGAAGPARAPGSAPSRPSRCTRAPTPPPAPAPAPPRSKAPPPPAAPGAPEPMPAPPPPLPTVFPSEGKPIDEKLPLAGWHGTFFIRDAKDYFRIYPKLRVH